METLNFNELKKKKKHIGFRVSDYEKKQINLFCRNEQISKADFLRYAIRMVIKEKNDPQCN